MDEFLKEGDGYLSEEFVEDGVKIMLRDAFVALEELEDNSCDLAICDPPYGAASSKKWNYDTSKKIKGFGGDWKLNGEEWDLLSSNLDSRS